LSEYAIGALYITDYRVERDRLFGFLQ
jgi:hypothetical protein